MFYIWVQYTYNIYKFVNKFWVIINYKKTSYNYYILDYQIFEQKKWNNKI